MAVIQIDKKADFNIDSALLKRFHRLQNDYNWIISHKQQLRNEYPNKYVAVENKTVRYVGDSMENLIATITKNHEQIDNFAIEYISEHQTSLLF